MGKNSKDTYGADGSTSLLSFYPEKLVIVTDPASPLYDERINLPLDETMIRNIQTFGVLEPIIVTRDPDSGDVLVIDGRQRVRHALEANKRLDAAGLPLLLVPATTRKGDDDAALMSIMVATNEIRQADPPMVRAAKMQRMKARGMDDTNVALAFGVTTKTVENHLSLLDCARPVQKAIEQGFIGVSDAKYLSRLPPDQQRAKVEEIVKATVGKEGHARAKAKREVIHAGTPQAAPGPKLKTRAQIEAQWHKAKAESYGPDYLGALEFVLGGRPTSEPEKDTKTADLFDASKAAETVA
jgi:ParB family chromosome partitioning protein